MSQKSTFSQKSVSSLDGLSSGYGGGDSGSGSGSSNGSDNNNVGSNLSETRDNDAVGGTSNVLVQAHTHCIMFTSGYFRPMDL